MKRFFLLSLVCVLGLFGNLRAQEETISIGSGDGAINYSPTYVDSYYSVTQQIFTAAEMQNKSGKITSVAFKCTSRTATRTFKVYMVNTDDGNKKFLLPTAETALVNIHSNEIMNINELPKKYFAYTQCFRVEAGSSREEERGTIRGHQFNKVEMVQYVTEEKCEQTFNELLNIAEGLMKNLGLHYQVSKLAAKDCSGAMCKTYDIEVWIPSMGIYKEVSSVSNSRDYQARRNNTKYRDNDGNIKYACTLNASGLATSRLVPAIVEQYQNKDGSITVPEVLRPYMNDLNIIV